MLRVFIVWQLGKKVAGIVKAKGRSPGGYVVLLIFMWISGEISGAVGGTIFSMATAGPGEGPDNVVAYFCALLGAVVGAITTFLIVKSLSDLRDEFPLRERDFDDRDTAMRDVGKHFSSSDLKRDDFTTDPKEPPRLLDDRYKSE